MVCIISCLVFFCAAILTNAQGINESNQHQPLAQEDIVILESGSVELEWQKALGGSNSDYAYDIAQTSEGSYIVVGETSSNDGNVSGNHGSADAWAVKLNFSGAVEWQTCLGGSSGDWAYSVQTTDGGGCILAGATSSNDGNVSGNHGSADAWVVKLNFSGAVEWQRCLGGSGWDEARSIKQTSDGGYIVAGTTNSNDGNVSGNHGSADIWVVKLNSSGSIEWQKCLGGSGWDEGWSIQQTNDKGYVVAGSTNSNDGDVSGNHGSSDFWVVKLDLTGAIQWQKCLGGSSDDETRSIKQSSDGGYIVAGTTNSNEGNVSGSHGGSDFWVVKLDSAGVIQWQKCLGGSDLEEACSIMQTVDGGYIVSGTTNSNDGNVSGNHGMLESWVVKLDPVGSIQWQKCLGGSSDEDARSIRQTVDSGFIIAGSTQSSDGDVLGYHLESGGDIWVVKISSSLAPVITSQPSNLTICEGNSALFSVTASSTGTIAYQWKKNGAAISGATTSSFSISSAKLDDAGSYSVDVTNACGTTSSKSASLTVNGQTSITTQPSNLTICEGNSALFSVTASSTGTIAYQWKKNGAAISGATTASLSISSAKLSDAGSYSVDVTNSCGTTSSKSASLTVNRLPLITTQPQSKVVQRRQSVLLSVIADGTKPLTYQWKKNGAAISGATSSSFSISSVKPTDAGSYTVDVRNLCGIVTSKAATLTVR
jgi:hypothetical protein